MANLGNLWFSLGLDDKKFEKEWKAALAKYSKDAKINIDFKISEKAVAELKKLKDAGMTTKEAQSYASLATSIMKAASAQEKYNRELAKTKLLIQESNAKITRQDNTELEKQALIRAKTNKLEKESVTNNKNIAKSYNDQSLWLQNLSSIASNYFSLYAIKNFATEVAMATGEFEKQRVTLQAMVGEMQGLELYGKMKELAVVSPFEFKDLASYVKQLAAFSVPYEELYDTTKRLADVSAGLGVDMSRIILAYGQIRSAGVLKGTELRQLTEAGVPILDKLAEKLEKVTGKAVSVGDVFDKISQKAVSFEMVKDVFTEITSEGGKFFNMQEVQAETLAGKISNLKDAYAIMLTEIGDSSKGVLSFGVDSLYKLINNWETLGRVILSTAIAYSAYQAAHIAAFGGNKLNLIGVFIQKLFRLRGNIDAVAESMARFNKVSKAGVWGAVLAVIAGLTTALISAYRASEKFNREIHKITSEESLNFDNEVRALKKLTTAIEETTQGTESRRIAIDEYNRRFGQYLSNMYDESTALETIKNGYEDVRKAMSDRYKEEALIQAKNKVEDEYGSKLTTTEADYKKILQDRGFGAYSASAIEIIKDVLEKNQSATIVDIQKAFNEAFKDGIIANNLRFRFEDYFEDYKKDYIKYVNALKAAFKVVDDSFNLSAYKSWKKLEDEKQIVKEYEEELKDIRDREKAGSKELKQGEKDAEIRYLTKLTQLYADLPEKLKEYNNRLEELKKEKKIWRETIAKDVEKLGLTIGFAPKEDENYPKYIERIREEWKNTTEAIEKYNGKDVDGGLETLKKEEAALVKLASLWGFILDPKKTAKTAKEKEKERVNALKEESQWVLKLYESYKKYLSQDLSSAEARKSALSDFEDIPEEIKKSFEGGTDISKWFRAEWLKIAEEAKIGGSDIGEALSTSMLLKLGTINTSEILQSLKLGEKIQQELDKWGLGDFTLTGEGVNLDISKALRDQYEADKEAAKRKEDLLNQIAEAEKGNEVQIAALKEKYGEEWLANAKKRANELYELEIANNAKIAKDKIQDLAKTMAKEQLGEIFSPDFFTNLGGKTAAQLEQAMESLTKLMESYPEYSAELLASFQKNGGGEDFLKDFREFFGLLAKDVSVQKFEKLKSTLVATGNAVSDIVGSFKELADTDSSLSGLLEGIGTSVKTATSIASAFEKKVTYDKEGNKLSESMSLNWGSIASAAATLVTNIISSVVAAREYKKEMERAAESFKNSIILSRREAQIAGEEFNTIFGEDLISALQADSSAIKDIAKDLKKASLEVAKIKITTKKGIFGIGRKQTTLKDLAPQLFNANGSVNYKYIDEFLTAYGDKLDDAQKAILENLKSNYELYEDAMGDINDYLTNIFSDTASTIADRMMESFAATGDAATELGDLVSNVAKQMAKDLIQSLLIDQYLTPAMDRIKAMYNPQDSDYVADTTLRTQQAILAIQDAMSAAQMAFPEVNALMQALKDMGIDLSTESSNASDVLSGLTEDQQNLMLSYLNGIRADVSINKGMLSSIVNSVGTVNNNLATALIVWKQIEANTHRSADGVDKIIGYFESVTGPYDGGGGQAFRVNIA